MTQKLQPLTQLSMNRIKKEIGKTKEEMDKAILCEDQKKKVEQLKVLATRLHDLTEEKDRRKRCYHQLQQSRPNQRHQPFQLGLSTGLV